MNPRSLLEDYDGIGRTPTALADLSADHVNPSARRGQEESPNGLDRERRHSVITI
jgi:hypothetical protein